MPTLLQETGSHEWKEIYNPYPYKSEEVYAKDLEKLWKSVPLKEDTQVILMTHDGPQDSATASYIEANGNKKRYGSVYQR